MGASSLRLSLYPIIRLIQQHASSQNYSSIPVTFVESDLPCEIKIPTSDFAAAFVKKAGVTPAFTILAT